MSEVCFIAFLKEIFEKFVDFRCFKNWNTGYFNLNQRPICEEFEGQLYTLSYDYECFEGGSARCIKTPNRCQYETCKLDTKFIACLQSMKPMKVVVE